MKVLGMLAAAAVTAMALTGRAAEFYYVATNGSDSSSGTNWPEAYKTISNAVAQADGPGPYTVYVSNGTYTLSKEIVLTNNILVRSWAGGELDPVGTIVDGTFQTRCFWLRHADAALAGFTIRNGTNSLRGGGVYVAGGGTVSNCLVTGNSAVHGAGLFITNGGLVTACTVRENVAFTNPTPSSYGQSRGGGVMLWNGGVLSDCTIADNSVLSKHGPGYQWQSGGGGIGIHDSVSASLYLIHGCLISNNYSLNYGGGFYLFQSAADSARVVVSDTTVASNQAVLHGGGFMVSGGATITGCVVEGNAIPYYAGIDGSDTPGRGGGLHGGITVIVKDSVLRGNSGNLGGGAYLTMLAGSTVESNTAYRRGGGLVLGGADYVISNSVIRGNGCNVTSGGGIDISGYRAWPTIRNCEICANTAKTYGGGIGIVNVLPSNPTGACEIVNCLIYDNVAAGGNGGGICHLNTAANTGFVVSACTITSNRSSVSGGGFYMVSGTLINSIIHSNDSASVKDLALSSTALTGNVFHCCIPLSLPAEQDNIPDEPGFRDFPGADFRLTAGSPCVNAGTNEAWMENALDLAGRPRRDRFSGQADIGACEYLPEGILFRLR